MRGILIVNKFFRFIAAFSVICILLSFAPASNAYYERSNDNSLLYGRRQLDRGFGLSALEIAYDRIVEGIERRDSSIFLADLFLSKEELQHVFTLYKNDPHPHFWLGSGYSYSSFIDGTVYALKPSYNELGTLSAAEFNSCVDRFNSEVDAIIKKAGITDGMSQYEIELRIHDTLVRELDYKSGINAHNAYGAIVEKSAVCQGYTLAFNYILRVCKIEAHYVFGTSKNAAHAWSLVKIDGDYFYTDITWDDPLGSYSRSEVYHSYFNLSYRAISKDHAFNAISYELPPCTNENGSYFARTPERVMTGAPDVDSVGALFEDGIAAVYVPEELFDTFINWYAKNILELAEKAGYDTSKGISFFYTYMGCEFHLIIEGTPLEPVIKIVVGDLDGDGQASGIDSNLLKRIISGSLFATLEDAPGADLDGDGNLTSVDSNLLKRLIAGN